MRILLLISLMTGIFPPVLTAQTRHTLAGQEMQMVDRLAGKWQLTGQWVNSPFTKESLITSLSTCRISPNGSYLICDQLNQQSNDLVVFTYDTTLRVFRYYSLSNSGNGPYAGQVLIRGNRWIYPGSFRKSGKLIRQETTNDFVNPGKIIFRIRYSRDSGKTWITGASGVERRIR